MLPDKCCYFLSTYYISGTVLCISHAVLLIFTTLQISILIVGRGKLLTQGQNTGLRCKPRSVWLRSMCILHYILLRNL